MTVPLHVFKQTVRSLFAPIACFLDADDIDEIMINGHDEIYVEKEGRLHLTSKRFHSEHALMSALRNLSQYVGRDLSPEKPILEARLPDGARVEAIIPPAARGGPSVCIRRFPKSQLTFERLVEVGAIAADSVCILRNMVARRHNVVIGGGSGSGKTSLLNALSCLVREDERVVVIEDAQELHLSLPHIVQLEAQPPDLRGHGGVTVRELFRATLRMRPDRIIIGEIRGGEALELIQAMTSGHRGCLATIHGTLPRDTLSRLETMALMSDVELPLHVLRAQIASAIDGIVQVARLPDGKRLITHIVELHGYDWDLGYGMHTVFDCGGGMESST